MSHTIVNARFLKQYLPHHTIAFHVRNCPWFELKEGQTHSVRNMSDAELREAIIEDLLTMARLDIGYVSLAELTLLITSGDQYDRIREQMGHPDITSRVLQVGNRFKIRFTRDNLKGAFDFVGIYNELNPLVEA